MVELPCAFAEPSRNCGAVIRRSIFIPLLLLFLAPLALANTPPAAPVIVEPSMELQALNGADVHMVTAQFADADGDEHRCTDWEIRDVDELVWSAPCAEGPLATHIHLGDGVFSGSHTDASELRAESRFELRVRHRDDSGDPAMEWSAWTSRHFQTVVPTPVAPMRLREVLTEHAPRWRSGAEDMVPPPGAILELQTVDGDPLFRFGASDIEAAESRPSAVVIRLRLAAGDDEWRMPESELSFENGNGQPRTIYLPALSLAAHSEQFYWISANGGTHIAAPQERTPDFTEIARGAPVPWTVERGFQAEVFATGLELPVSIVAVPNPGHAPDSPFLYVAELYGKVKVVTRGGEVREFAKGLLNFDPRAPIPGNGERGLGGITIDPVSGDIIVTSVYQTDRESPWVSPRVLRLQSDDGGYTAARVISLVEFGDAQAPSHQISNVTFGPDDKLYVHVGSSFSWVAQDLSTTDGKILRMNRDGSAPSDNPFYDAGDGINPKDYIFALGFRNPFGGAWRFADQSLYEVENGPATDRLAKVMAGRNYLWDGTDASMRNHAIYNWNLPVAPIQIAFTERERFGGSGFPENKLRSAFVTESGATWASGPQQYGKKISEFVIGPDETLVSGPTTFAEYNGSGKATAAGLLAGPDGLFFTDLYKDYGQTSPLDAGANIIRIRWVGFADFTSRFERSSTIALTDRSDVPDAQSVSWDFDDGTTSSERNPVHRYEEAGTYVIRQTITGPRGTVARAQRVFAGGDTEPVRAEYYESDQDPTPAAVQTEQSLHFDWSDGTSALPVSAEGFAARFAVEITPRFSENYAFTVRSHDKVRVLLDGKPLIDAWEPDGSGEATGSIRLVAGRKYELTVQYVKSSDAPALTVSWKSASQGSFIVPRSAKVPRRRAVTPR